VIGHHQQASAEYIFNSVKSLKEQTGIGNIGFVEEGSRPEILEQFARLVIDGKLDIEWRTNVKLLPDVTLGRCLLFRRSGCSQLYCGLETYNDRLLRLMKKGISTETIYHALMNMSWAGLSAYVYLMVGLPTETEREALLSYRAIRRLQKQGFVTHYAYSPYELMPGSDVFEHPSKYGIRISPLEPKYDLFNSPCRRFEGMPISQQRAADLTAKFNQGKPMKPWVVGKEIRLSDRTVRLKHTYLK